MARNIGDVSESLLLYHDVTEDVAIIPRDRDGTNLSLSGFTDARLGISVAPGYSDIISRSVSGGNASIATIDGLQGVLCDGPTSLEWEDLIAGRYFGQLWLKDSGGEWHPTNQFVVTVIGSIGAPA